VRSVLEFPCKMSEAGVDVALSRKLSFIDLGSVHRWKRFHVVRRTSVNFGHVSCLIRNQKHVVGYATALEQVDGLIGSGLSFNALR